jgi:hypothetical protein
MPPAGKPAPTPDERRALAGWIAAAMLGVDAARPDPGRVTIRRLNRVEYEHSVQDLFGVNLAADQEYSTDVADPANASLKLRDRLPPDETAFGFDNVGDFLTLPPALLERFFEIAELVVGRVVSVDGPRSPEQSFGTTRFETVKAADARRTEQSLAFDAPHAGEYRVELQFTVGGWQDFGGAYDFTAAVGNDPVAAQRLEIGGYKKHKFAATVKLPAGRHVLSLVTDAKLPDAKGVLKHLELRPAARVTGPLGPQFVEYPAAHRGVFFKGDAPRDPAARKAYAREILDRVATRAFRRPVDATTLDGLVDLSAGGDSFERGVAQAITAILTSPRFLFRAESQPRPDDPASIHPLDEYALASRLSYFLWLSLPDDELMSLAAKGELRQNLRPQIRRLLAHPKSARFFEDFPGQWLRTRNVLMTAISGKAGAKLEPVRASMKRETEMLFEHVARNDRDLIELITADYTFLDKGLADFYGIPGVPETGVHQVKLAPESHRGGILTHGSFLVSTSNPNRTSPVKRGLFVLENLLGVEAPPPPPNIPALDDVNLGDTSKKTGRELLALHREAKSCAACHAHFDPIGVALENFDVAGRWRDDEDGLPIDTAERTVSGKTVRAAADVRDLLAADKEKFYRGVTEKLMTYALGRGLEPADSVTVDRIARDLVADGGKFSTLLTHVVESPAFQTRRGDAGGAKFAGRDNLPQPPPPDKRRPPKKSAHPSAAPAASRPSDDKQPAAPTVKP